MTDIVSGKPVWRNAVVVCATVLAIGWAQAAELVLKKGARVAITGDSITYQKIYSKYIETYLLVCRPDLDVSVAVMGQNGQGAGIFLSNWITNSCRGSRMSSPPAMV